MPAFREGTRRYGSVERVAVGATSAQSAAMSGTDEVLLHATVDCYILAAADPTAAATTSIPMAAGEKFHMQILPGQKIAVIRATEDGFLYVAQVI